jgi:ribosomal 50S subunit-recycling heat shock protein
VEGLRSGAEGHLLLFSSAPLLLHSPSSPLLLSTMRIDVFLKLSRLEPRRTMAQQMCEAGAIQINGTKAKSGREVRIGDLIALRRRGRITTVRVAEIPSRPPSKAQASSMYETIGVEHYEPEVLSDTESPVS